MEIKKHIITKDQLNDENEYIAALKPTPEHHDNVARQGV